MKIFNRFIICLCISMSLNVGYAFSAVVYRHVINWSETPESLYEIEISKDEKENIVIKKIINESTYKLVTEAPGLYYWRYRAKEENKWTPFSGYSVIKFKGPEDKDKKTLMISPVNGEKIKYKHDRVTLNFNWEEPDPEATYLLELYFSSRKTPSRVMTVKGGSHAITLKKIPEKLFWRVFRKKSAGEKRIFVNKEKFEIKLIPSLDDFKPTENFLLSLTMFQAKSEFSFDAPNNKYEESFTGQILEFNAEYFPKFWDRRKSLNFFFRNASFSKDSLEISNKRFGLEFGLVVGDGVSDHHQIYLGYQFINNIEMDFGSALATDYDQSLISGRYLYRKQFTDRFAFEMNAVIQMGSFSVQPSAILKPGVNYLWQKDLWINGFAIYERYLSEIDDSSRSTTVTIEQTNSGIGLGLTWMPGKD